MRLQFEPGGEHEEEHNAEGGGKEHRCSGGDDLDEENADGGAPHIDELNDG